MHTNTVRATRRRLAEARARRAARARRGSTLVVVISLLALLSILGVTINLFTQQAAVSARYMSEGSKVTEDPELDPDILMEFAVEQLILGAGPGFEQSALYGGRHSLLPNMFGRDLHPFSGRGINLIDADLDGIPEVDQNYDGMADTNSGALYELNDSSAAHGGSVRSNFLDHNGAAAGTDPFPSPDPDFTRPDINASWLGFSGYALDAERRPVFVVIPSFHRPQYLRQSAGWTPIRDWDTNAATRRQVLRPHSQHEIDGFPGTPRFLTGGVNPFPFGQSSSGVWNMRNGWQGNTPQQPRDWIFPDPNHPNPAKRNTARLFFRADNAGTTSTTEPNWASAAVGTPITDGGVSWTPFNQPFYEYDADPDKDGVKESVYLDLGFPVQDFGGELFVPLFAFHVVDGDSRVNVNFHGNAQGHANVVGGGAFGRKTGVSGAIHMLHESNHGLTPFEVNLARVLTANPANITPGTKFDRLRDLFTDKSLSDYRELANAELFTLLKGLPHLDPMRNLEKRNEGRHGEAGVAENAYVNSPTNPLAFPRAGRSGFDDDNNSQFGEQIPEQFDNNRNYNLGDWVVARVQFAGNPFDLPLLCTAPGTGGDDNVPVIGSISPGYRFRDGSGNAEWMVFHYPFGTLSSHFGHPSDIRGMGSIHQPNSLALNVLAPTTSPKEPLRWLQHLNTPTAQGWNKWGIATGGSPLLKYDPYLGPGNRFLNAYVDDPMETFTSNGNGDALFSAADSSFLLHSPTVQATIGTSSRIAALAKLNLVDDPNAVERRKRLTTISWDLRTRGVTPAPIHRPWERTSGVFPPEFAGAPVGSADDPIRPALRQWLLHADTTPASANGKTPLQVITQRLASANHVLEMPGAATRPNLKRLTAHPARLSPNPVTSSSTGINAQEYQARLDRQRLARDIYVLLYTFCGGWDDVDPTTDSNAINMGTTPNAIREIYDDSQTEAMARFAVNLVDAMDGDDVMTAFEYDRDLSDGWNLDDDAFSETGDGISLANDRGVVFGVEAQTLTLSETLVTQARLVRDSMMMNDPADYARTRHDDTQHRDWTYVELRNVSPHAIGFDNEAWKIVIQQPSDIPVASRNIRARHLIPIEGTVGGGNLFTIGTSGDDVTPSEFAVDTTPMATGTFTRYVPPATSGNLDLDLIEATDEDEFRLHDTSAAIGSMDAVDALDPPLSGGNVGEGGMLFDNTAATEKGKFLEFLDPDMANNEVVEFVLMRRMHPYRIAPDPAAGNFDAQSRDNPWIEVDRSRTRVRRFGSDNTAEAWHLDPNSDAMTSLTEVEEALRRLWSTERDEALVRLDFAVGGNNVVTSPAFPPMDLVQNSIGDTNQATDDHTGTAGTQSHFEVLQLHFDRDLTSPIDMLTVPLYGPHQLTDPRLGITSIGRPFSAFPNTAGADRFLRPVAPGAYGTDGQLGGAMDEERDPSVAGLDDPYTYKHNNRWYRLLGLVGTPTPMVDVTNGTSDQLVYKLPGKINWNTMSYPEVLAALLDEDTAFRPWSTTFTDGNSYPLKPNELPKQHGYLASADNAENESTDGPGGVLHRDWWVKFLQQRDQQDPVTSFILPGTASGTPFRSPMFMANETNSDPFSQDYSLLRGLGDVDPTMPAEFMGRRLFELNTADQRYGGSLYDDTDGQDVDLHTRHKLLSRAWNNSTTRSNTMFVYVQVDFFEVTDAGGGAFQIGGKKTGFPTHRGFFVVDRTLAYATLKGGTGANGHFRAPGPTTGFSIKGIREDGFDFRDVIVHSELIE